MERVTLNNINQFYNGERIFTINQMNGYEEIFVFVNKDKDDLIVRRGNLLCDCECGTICSLQSFEIIKSHYYYFNNEKEIYQKRIEWHKKEINRLEQFSNISDSIF
jgi:hypothetical protein